MKKHENLTKQEISVIRAVADLTPALIAFIDTNERYQYVNANYERWFKRPAKDFLGKTIEEVFGTEISDKRKEHVHAVLRGEEVSFEAQSPYPGDEPLEVMICYKPYIDKYKKVRGFVVHITENEERKRLEEIFLQLSENLNNQVLHIMEATPAAISYVSPSYEKIWGRPVPELFENPFAFMNAIHPDDLKAVEKALRGQELGQPLDITYRIIRPDGEIRWIHDTASPVFDRSGKFIRATGIADDITERKQAEANLAFERHKLEMVFMKCPAAMALWRGPDLTYEMVNPAYQALFEDREILGKPMLEAHPEMRDQIFPSLVMQVLESGKPFYGREMLVRIAKTAGEPLAEKYFDTSFLRVNDIDGKPYGVFNHALDVTERVMAKRGLEAAKLEAERANASKTAFLANMSHEIRTPMTAVLGFAEILRNPDLPEDLRKDALMRIDRSGRSLLKLIDDVLDISKVEAGKLTIEKSRFSPLEITTEVTELLRLQAEQRGLSLTTKFEDSVPVIAQSDSARVRQILTNLIGNAIKFTKEGHVAVNVSAETDKADGKQYLIFEVSDTGMGIAQPDREKLFRPFAQADQSITREFGGTGLGLVLSKRLSQLLGGDLFLKDSKLNEGSRFVAKIEAGPFEISRIDSSMSVQPEHPVSSKIFLHDARVLVVDDVPDNQILLRRYLESAGARVDVAGDGEEAVSKALDCDYDVVLMDIQMPHVDGIQATKRLRAQGYRRPILALTAHAMREEINRSAEAGCDEHLTKPVTKQTLVSAVSRWSSL
jgi:PAS domain S-box-containing protein